MKRKPMRSLSPKQESLRVIEQIGFAVVDHLRNLGGIKERKAILPQGYEVHAYHQQPHMLRIDIHRRDKRPFYSSPTMTPGDYVQLLATIDALDGSSTDVVSS